MGWSILSKTTNKFSPEVRERAVRLVLDNEGQHGSRWQAVMSISAKIGDLPPGRPSFITRVFRVVIRTPTLDRPRAELSGFALGDGLVTPPISFTPGPLNHSTGAAILIATPNGSTENLRIRIQLGLDRLLGKTTPELADLCHAVATDQFGSIR